MTLTQSDNSPSTVTLCLLPVKKDFIHCNPLLQAHITREPKIFFSCEKLHIASIIHPAYAFYVKNISIKNYDLLPIGYSAEKQ